MAKKKATKKKATNPHADATTPKEWTDREKARRANSLKARKRSPSRAQQLAAVAAMQAAAKKQAARRAELAELAAGAEHVELDAQSVGVLEAESVRELAGEFG